MMQRADEDIKHFAARIQGQAEICDYTVQYTNPDFGQFVSYIEQGFRQAFISHYYEKLKLDEVKSFISTREQ